MGKEDFVFGTRAVAEAISSGKVIEKVLIKTGLDNELFHELYAKIKEFDVPMQFVPVEKINRITRKNHQGVVALLSPIEYQKIEDVLPMIWESGKEPLILILDQVSDVRNFGAVTRSAECAGVDAIIIPEKGAARVNADTIKTSAGAIFNIPICRSKSLLNTFAFLKESGINIVAATEKAEINYTDVKMDIPLAIVLGSEEKGISKVLLESSDNLVKIPILGQIQSLNISVAASILIYEAVRQRAI